jgi:murein L,D-transpeptidase YcbB/YkuD
MRAGRLVRPARLSLGAMALAMAAVPASAGPLTSAAALAQPLGGQSVADFYAARDHRPLWLQDGNGAAATALLDLLRTADADGLDPADYRVGELSRSLRSAWGGSPAQVRQADRMLSEAFVAYVRDLRKTPQVPIVWVDPALKPKAPSPRALLDSAVKAPDLERWLADMRFMNPIYAGLRHAIARGEGGDPHLLRLNLERARALPSGPGRFILVNATAQRLTMYEDGEAVDSMKVVVGKAKNPTPMMAAYVRFAALNPYWYVPPDLAAERIAPNVLKDGLHYLQRQGYQVMSDWADSASVVDPETVDWQAVADGSKEVHIRQLPGPYNAMGQMKFMFPNDEGIYLHDTPQKELLTEASRLFSGGCVRLEDAPRLGRWLFGEALQSESKQAELTRSLPKPVPLFITYLTVMPTGTDLATFPDIYGRDKQELAMMGSRTMAVR